MPDVTCPHCKNVIDDEDALRCHFCGESLGLGTSTGLIGAMRGAGMKWVMATIAIAILLALALTMF